MESSDYPALYNSADEGSNAAQRHYLRAIRAEYFFLSLLALVGSSGIGGPDAPIILILLLLFLFGLLIYRHVSKLDERWYRCRALAESVKTSTWKYLMCAHPYERFGDPGRANRAFLVLLGEIRRANEFLGDSLSTEMADRDQITSKMSDIRLLSVEQRLDFYLTHRVRHQRTWYAKKAKANRSARTGWFAAAIFFYALAAISLFSFQFTGVDLSWTMGVLMVLVASSFGWTQVKRHGELAASYLLTAHEIGGVIADSESVNDEQMLSDFVSAAEFAFSREHTQWAARRDFG